MLGLPIHSVRADLELFQVLLILEHLLHVVLHDCPRFIDLMIYRKKYIVNLFLSKIYLIDCYEVVVLQGYILHRLFYFSFKVFFWERAVIRDCHQGLLDFSGTPVGVPLGVG